MLEKRKVFAYVTRGQQLLVFEHTDAPEAGIQVPAGTVEAGETIEHAVLREAREETGLQSLVLVDFLGYQRRDMSDYDVSQIHHRYFYHLRCDGDAPDRWTHLEKFRSDSSPRHEPFLLYWVDLPDGVPDFIADHGILIETLVTRMGLR